MSKHLVVGSKKLFTILFLAILSMSLIFNLQITPTYASNDAIGASLISKLTTTINLVNWSDSIDTIYIGTMIGNKSLSDLTVSYNQLTAWSDILKWSAVLKKFGIENQTLIKQALNDASMMDNGLPKTGVWDEKDGIWIEDISWATWAYYYAEKYNYLTSTWNKTKAYESVKLACDNNNAPPSAILYDNTIYQNAHRLLEADATIFDFLAFYDIGVSSALDDAEKWWVWTNDNHWVTDHYIYATVNNEPNYVWDTPDLIQAALKLYSYRPAIGNTSRLLIDTQNRYLLPDWAGKQWIIDTTKYYASVHHNPDNPTRMMAGMPIAWADILGQYAFYGDTYKTRVQNMMEGFNGHEPAWRTLFNYSLTSHRLYNAASGRFRMEGYGYISEDDEMPPSDIATAYASALLLILGIVPKTAKLAIPLEYFWCGYYNIYDNEIYSIDITDRKVKIAIANPGTVEFLFNASVTSMFDSSGSYQITFSTDWNSVTSIERLGDLPQRVYNPFDSYDVVSLVDGYSTGDDYYGAIFHDYYNWRGQSFIPPVTFNITSVRLKLYRIGSPDGYVIVGINTLSGLGYTGTEFAASAIECNYLTTDSTGAWYQFNFSGQNTLYAGTRYIIEVRANYTVDSPSNRPRWRCDSLNPTYPRGSRWLCMNQGQDSAGWLWSEELDGGIDAMFEIYGILHSLWSVDIVKPQFSNIAISTTQIEKPCTFSVTWFDTLALTPNGGYIFGCDVGLYWINDTFKSFTSNPQTISVIKILPENVRTVSWRVWARDHAGNWNDTGVQSFQTTLTHIVPSNITIGFDLLSIKAYIAAVLNISEFAAGILLSLIFTVTLLLIAVIFVSKNGGKSGAITITVIIVSLSSIVFCTAIQWIAPWVSVFIGLGTALGIGWYLSKTAHSSEG